MHTLFKLSHAAAKYMTLYNDPVRGHRHQSSCSSTIANDSEIGQEKHLVCWQYRHTVREYFETESTKEIRGKLGCETSLGAVVIPGERFMQ